MILDKTNVLYLNREDLLEEYKDIPLDQMRGSHYFTEEVFDLMMYVMLVIFKDTNSEYKVLKSRQF